MKKIAIITGASSGMGKVFAETINTYDTFDEVWVIARRLDRLESLQETVPFPVRPIALDLTDRESFRHYEELLENAQANVSLLVNCSGYGKFQAACETPLAQNLNMVDLNCEALMAMCQLTIPYMHAGAQIINIASVAACALHRCLRGKQGLCSELQPELKSRARRQGHLRHGRVSVLDEDGILRPCSRERGKACCQKICRHV